MTEKTCFVIAPIGEKDSDIRKRSDLILDFIISPPLKENGYNPIRADKISEPGMITSQIIQHVVDDPLVIADLTDRNPNVFYELALRHAIRKPFIQLIQKGEKIPFDVHGVRTIEVDHKDLRSSNEAIAEIGKQIKSLEADPGKIETPISVTLAMQTLRESGNPEKVTMADVLTILTEIKSQLQTKNEDAVRAYVRQHQMDRQLKYWEDIQKQEMVKMDRVIKLVYSKLHDVMSDIDAKGSPELYAKLVEARAPLNELVVGKLGEEPKTE